MLLHKLTMPNSPVPPAKFTSPNPTKPRTTLQPCGKLPTPPDPNIYLFSIVAAASSSTRPQIYLHQPNRPAKMAAPSSKQGDKPAAEAAKPETSQQPQEKSAAALEEDDEFEDFPVEDWPAEETEAAATTTTTGGGNGTTTQHLWEESWDDDDTTDDFSTQLREELKKVEASKRR
ncbi:DSS1/SEM1 family-domain-containing protein [Hypoxylon sp. FL1150]|nr:DSS1/SEM1 family-domain-containing protein [Hypoxylon sp. FL1150]